MSYLVLARKWRPKGFGSMVGQAHVVKALSHALDHNRLHHAYLFTGTRGVGKTTLARIVAKCLNCEEKISSNPCGQCSACREIDAGIFVDLLEVDAASRTKVEDTRELLDNVQYRPTKGRYKIYLIDEVHMLSTHSFNALLKTLEEPPSHVKFLLATTDPQRLPVTVLSRCLQFNLKALPVALIAQHLNQVLQQENIGFDAAALQMIAQAAQGSVRDALSLLDQAIAHGAGSVREPAVQAMLGHIGRDAVTKIIMALAANAGHTVLELVEEAADLAMDFFQLLAQLIEVLHRIAILQMIPAVNREEDAREWLELAQKIPAEEIQLWYQIALIGRKDLELAFDPRTALEMVLLRILAFRPVLPTAQISTKKVPAGPVSVIKNDLPARTLLPELHPANTTHETSVTATQPIKTTDSDEWSHVVKQLTVGGMVRQLAANCVIKEKTPDTLHLVLAPNYAQLKTKAVEEKLKAALIQYYQQVNLQVLIDLAESEQESPAQRDTKALEQRRQAALDTIKNDPIVNELVETFNAQIAPGSIQPVD